MEDIFELIEEYGEGLEARSNSTVETNEVVLFLELIHGKLLTETSKGNE